MPTPRTPDQFIRGGPLSADAFRDQARRVAPDLLGSLLLVEEHPNSENGSEEPAEGAVGGIVVETEAYVNGVDPASHLAAGRTDRTASFFSGPGTVYVYSIHGHHLLNVITVNDGYPEGVLVRALEPTHGLDVMRERRGFEDPDVTLSGRIGISEAGDWPLRFTVTDNEFLSQSIPAEESLDHHAIERCYERLGENGANAHALDDEHEPG